MSLNEQKWHATYECLGDAKDAVALPIELYSGATQVDPAILRRAIDNAFHAVKDELQAMLPTGYTPPMDDRAEELVAAITRYAFGAQQ